MAKMEMSYVRYNMDKFKNAMARLTFEDSVWLADSLVE